MDLLVVGAGSMGRWVARTLSTDRPDRESGESPESPGSPGPAGPGGESSPRGDGAGDGDPFVADDVAFVDADRSTARTAADAVGGRTVDLDAVSDETGETFDVVCLAVPMPEIATAAPALARADRLAMDVTGVMGPAVAALGEHAPDRERLSLHPLFAPEAAPGRVAAVVDRDGPVGRAVRERLRAAGNRVVETTVEEHDRAMETVQARAHAAVLAYGLAADDVPEAFDTPVSRALSDLVDRVTGGDSRVYADVQATFDGADDLARAAREVADADRTEFEALYRAARPEQSADDGDEDGDDDGIDGRDEDDGREGADREDVTDGDPAGGRR